MTTNLLNLRPRHGNVLLCGAGAVRVGTIYGTGNGQAVSVGEPPTVRGRPTGLIRPSRGTARCRCCHRANPYNSSSPAVERPNHD